MARPSLLSRLKPLLMLQTQTKQAKPAQTKQANRGFTLLELLVVAAIAGGIISGLMFIVVQLMQADQRESARTETQREMQLAMDYISTELREAVFVYTGDYLPTLAQYIPASLSNDSVPVLAFWKQQPFPTAVQNNCVTATPAAGTSACMAGQSYALVVYSLARNPNPRAAGSVWRGGARITRYALTQFQGNSTTITQGYVDPAVQGNYDTWPIFNGTSQQAVRPSGAANTLVDFVDGQTTFNTPVRCPGDNPADPVKPYSISPPASMVPAGFPRSFYACVSSSNSTGTGASTQNLQTTGQYQDVVLYLRGSAVGRPGIPNNLAVRSAELLPTLETRVMLQGVLARKPPS